MQTPWDCLPCFLKQASMVAKTTHASREREERMVRGALKLLADTDFRVPPPHIAEKLYPMLCEVVGTPDPYREAKRHYNDLAMSLAEQLGPRCRASAHPLRMLVKLALAGNVIDYGVSDTFDLDGTIDRMLAGEPDVDEIDRLEDRLASARRVLYLADNAGEIAFDRLLIEHGIGPSRVTLAVRGGPIINDVTREDAEQVGLTGLVPVIDSGVAVPGIALERSSEAFLRAFEDADLILSKGQGNFETLESRRDPRVFYVFMIKCRAVGKPTGYPVKSSVAAFGDRFFLG
jgi:uncharacterized protein with ATP-grasp and redox domains